jgi:hypothetical protein
MTDVEIQRMAHNLGLDELAIQEGIRKPWETLLMMTKTAYGLYAFTHKDLEHFAALVAAHEREACAEMVWPTQQIKVWSDKEINAMTGAFNRAQEKHGWYETLMAVGAAALKNRAAAIRARGEAEYKRGEQ